MTISLEPLLELFTLSMERESLDTFKLTMPQVNNNHYISVGRSVDETLRLVEAFQYTDEFGEVCPANWKKGSATIVPDQDEKVKYFAQVKHWNIYLTNCDQYFIIWGKETDEDFKSFLLLNKEARFLHKYLKISICLNDHMSFDLKTPLSWQV